MPVPTVMQNKDLRAPACSLPKFSQGRCVHIIFHGAGKETALLQLIF
jgi:hypothetical protein